MVARITYKYGVIHYNYKIEIVNTYTYDVLTLFSYIKLMYT